MQSKRRLHCTWLHRETTEKLSFYCFLTLFWDGGWSFTEEYTDIRGSLYSSAVPATVVNLFLGATTELCWPSRVRTHKGGEKSEIARLMVEKRGEGRGSILRGSLVHNQRIERLWRDMRKIVTEYFRLLFHFLERNNLLNSNGDLDLAALHYVFIPQINENLEKFRVSWNNHKLATEKQKTPNQLYILGMLNLFGSEYRAVKSNIIADPTITAQRNRMSLVRRQRRRLSWCLKQCYTFLTRACKSWCYKWIRWSEIPTTASRFTLEQNNSSRSIISNRWARVFFAWFLTKVKLAKSLQTGCADQTIWSMMLFSMMPFTAVYYTTIDISIH